MQIVPLKKEHLDKINAQGAQDYVSTWITSDMKKELAAGNSFSVIDGGEVLGCGGIVEFWKERACVWAILSGNCGSRFVVIHRAVAGFLSLQDYRRLEATADVNFGAGQRWLEMLGFRLETPVMKHYLPNGADAAMYVRGV